MTHITDGVLIIEAEPEQQCDDCGELKECRPYDPNGSIVCFDCAMKGREGTKQRYHALIEEAML